MLIVTGSRCIKNKTKKVRERDSELNTKVKYQAIYVQIFFFTIVRKRETERQKEEKDMVKKYNKYN